MAQFLLVVVSITTASQHGTELTAFAVQLKVNAREKLFGEKISNGILQHLNFLVHIDNSEVILTGTLFFYSQMVKALS